jgi:hypothetical protein
LFLSLCALQFKARVTMDMKHRVVRAMIAGSMGDGDGAPVHVQDKTESVRDATRREHHRLPLTIKYDDCMPS